MPSNNRIEKIRLNLIVVDGRVQRSLDLARVKRMGEAFNWDGFGTPTLSRRDDGTIVVIDGQHRIMSARYAGHEDRAVQFRVFEGLTLQEEAELFRLLNDTRKPGPVDLFRVAVIEREPAAIAMNKMIEHLGMKVALAGDKAFRSVASLRSIYEVDPIAAERAINTLAEAWGPLAASMQAQLLTGLGRVLIRNMNEIRSDALVLRLGKYPGGAHALIGSARGLARIGSISVADAVATIIVKEYNKSQRGGGKLPDWSDEG